jgi:hypothetical protein
MLLLLSLLLLQGEAGALQMDFLTLLWLLLPSIVQVAHERGRFWKTTLLLLSPYLRSDVR